MYMTCLAQRGLTLPIDWKTATFSDRAEAVVVSIKLINLCKQDSGSIIMQTIRVCKLYPLMYHFERFVSQTLGVKACTCCNLVFMP